MKGLIKTCIILALMQFILASSAEATTLLDARKAVVKYVINKIPGMSGYQGILNSQIDSAIKQAQLYLLDVLPLSANQSFIKTQALTIVSGQQDYTLPTNFRRLITLAYRNYPAIQVRPEEFYAKIKSASSNDPMFMIYDGKIRLWPTPVTGNTAEIMFQAPPADLTSETSLITTAAEFDDLLTMTSVYFLSVALGKIDLATAAKEAMTEQVKAKATMFNTTVIEVKK